MDVNIYKLFFLIQNDLLKLIQKEVNEIEKDEIIAILSAGKIGHKSVLEKLVNKNIMTYDEFDEEYSFTKEGKEIYHHIKAKIEQYHGSMIRGIDMVEFDIFCNVLLKLNENIEKISKGDEEFV